ncbi:hypothetical protein HGRIS_003654 [Hohenbuehelia grisea]|uniref:Uncharacterized protein n=1 Tax=Hohenbuehelia grisea TaxID=104357 RepID=A0ABR3JGX2_9AGAR
MLWPASILLLLAIPFVHAQTFTVTNPAGQTIVQFVTIDPNLGVPTTSILQTLGGTTPTIPATPPEPEHLGPVGQPPTTTAPVGGPTPYTYTTEINGVLTAVTDIFTPTTPATISTSPTATGTIWQYSQWLSVYGAVSNSQSNAASALAPKLWICPHVVVLLLILI